MGSNATAATALSSFGAAGAFVGIIVWLLGMAHVQVPGDVAGYMVVLIGAATHAGWLKWALPTDAPAVPAAPAPVAPPAPPAA